MKIKKKRATSETVKNYPRRLNKVMWDGYQDVHRLRLATAVSHTGRGGVSAPSIIDEFYDPTAGAQAQAQGRQGQGAELNRDKMENQKESAKTKHIPPKKKEPAPRWISGAQGRDEFYTTSLSRLACWESPSWYP